MKKIINIMCIDVAKRNLCTFILIFGLILTIALSMGIVYVSSDNNNSKEITITLKKDGAGGSDTVIKIKSGECLDLKFAKKGLSKMVEENYEDVEYEQVGWNTSRNQSFSNVTPGTTFTKDTELWPVWESSETTVPKPVFFAPNGGKGEIPSIKVIGRIGDKLPKTIPEKEGFVFKGWSKTPGSQVADIDKNTYISSYMVCYAVWEKQSSNLNQQIEELKKQVETLTLEVKEYKSKLAEMTGKYKTLLQEINSLKEKFKKTEDSLREQITEAISEKNTALKEKSDAISEKEKALEEKKKAISERDKAIGEKDKAVKELETFKKITTAKSFKIKGFTGKIKGSTGKFRWKPVLHADGYILKYRKGSKGKVLTVKLGKNSISKYTVKKLKKGCIYKFSICTYKKVGKTTVYGGNSAIRLKINKK